MGLDMYLEKRTYVRNWDHLPEDRRHEITVKLGGKDHPAIKPDRISYIIEDIAYWRKANQVHQWFVDNCQDGNDDCGTHYVPREKLRDLLGIVNVVISEPTIAPDLLPTAHGFFFGSTEYDEGYLQDMEDTKRQLTEALAEDDDGEFYYHSSW